MDRRLVLVVSILVGCAAGWFARGAADAPSQSAMSDGPPPISSGAAGSLAGRARATPKSVSTTTAEEPPLAERLAKGTTSELARIRSADPEPVLDGASVDALVARLDAAMKGGDQKLFGVVVDLLGMANDPKGDAALVAVLADKDLDLPRPMVSSFVRALEDSSVPGIAAAARARCERNIAAGDTSWTAVDGWFALVAHSGSEADVEWLFDLGKKRSQWQQWAVGALIEADRHDGEGSIKNLFRNGVLRGDGACRDALGVLARRDPDAAAEFVRAVLHGESSQGQPMDVQDVLVAYANNAPVERLADVERWIGELSRDQDRLGAVSAIEALRGREYDTARLSSSADFAIVFIDRVADGASVTDETRHLLNKAGYAIEYNRTTWSERAASALERAADTLDRAGITVGGPDCRELAKKVRAGLKSRWK
jgi:hypothetical protein